LAIDECSDEDGQRLTIRISRRQGQRARLFFSITCQGDPMTKTTMDYAALVGLDWADEEHAYCLFSAGNDKPQHGVLKQRPEAIAEWVAELRRRFEGRPVAICLEQSRGALLFALMAYEFLHLYPINPVQLAAYRKAMDPSGAKDDPRDGELLARFLRQHRDQLRLWKPDDEITRGLRLLNEQRRDWVEQRVALENQLRQRLKESFPLALELLPGDLHAPRTLAFLAAFPTLKELQRASPSQLARHLGPRRRRCDDPPMETLRRQQLQTIRQALPLTQDRAILEHARLVICHVVRQIESMNKAIADCEQKIAQWFAEHPDHDLFSSLPGAGAAIAPRMAAAYGTDRDKFQDAGDMQQISGIAPITRRSGKSMAVYARWACPSFLRQTFHEFARCSVKFSVWAQAYLKMRMAGGARYHVAVRALAYKWQRVIFACWKNHQPYDEARYLQRLRLTDSPLLRYLPPNPKETP
jgi:transposase